MKRVILFLLISLSVAGYSYAQSPSLFEKYSKIEGIDGMEIGKSMMKVAVLAAKGDEKALLKKVERMYILNFEKVPSEIQTRYIKEVSSLKGMELVGDKEEKGERTICYAVTDGSVISRILIISSDSAKKQFLSMDLYGVIPVSLLEKLAHQ